MLNDINYTSYRVVHPLAFNTAILDVDVALNVPFPLKSKVPLITE
jgi:hypothetical protein